MNKNLCLNDSEREWVLKVKSILSKPQSSIPIPPPNNEIWYRSSDGNVVKPNKSNAFGANIVSNVYEDGVGIITFDGDVTSIGDYAFQNCKSLTSITIPNSVTSIGSSAFNVCSSLTSINIPNLVISIGGQAFNNCHNLTSITIGNSVTTIYGRAFSGCSGLTSVTIGNSVATIEGGAFSHCTGLTSINIPNFVEYIGSRAFEGCIGLTSITIPDSVTSIGGRAFNKCSGLTSITIPNSVTTIDVGVFNNCSGLTSIVVSEGNTVYDSRNNCNAIIETSTNKLILGCKNTIIPDSVTSIDYYAFIGCTGLTSVTIPNSITSIDGGGGTFEDCSGIISIVVSEGNTKYDSRNNCNAIIETSTNTLVLGCNNTIIPDSVTTIGRSAFTGCTSLTSITIPNKVTDIENHAFEDCTGLTSITFLSTTPPTISNSMQSSSLPAHDYIIYVPSESINAYKTDWSNFANKIQPIQ